MKTIRQRQRGAALLEALVAVLLFSFGILGIVALQAKSAQISVDSEDRTRAALLAGELASAMWAQQTTSLPTADVTAWKARVADATAAGLPGGAGSVDVDATTKLAVITITWKAPWKGTNASGTVDASTYVTQVMIP